jgi:hypothetical protein
LPEFFKLESIIQDANKKSDRRNFLNKRFGIYQELIGLRDRIAALFLTDTNGTV